MRAGRGFTRFVTATRAILLPRVQPRLRSLPKREVGTHTCGMPATARADRVGAPYPSWRIVYPMRPTSRQARNAGGLRSEGDLETQAEALALQQRSFEPQGPVRVSQGEASAITKACPGVELQSHGILAALQVDGRGS